MAAEVRTRRVGEVCGRLLGFEGISTGKGADRRGRTLSDSARETGE
jgi:hypothetical protein